MANLTNFTRTATAAIGALVISMTFVTAAVGPAAAAGDTSFATAVQSQVSVQEQQA